MNKVDLLLAILSVLSFIFIVLVISGLLIV